MTMTNNHNMYHQVNRECACFNFRKIARAITQFFDRHLEPHELKTTQFTLLINLAAGSSKTLSDMAETLGMDRTTLTRNLKPLLKLGLIQFKGSPDKRSKVYALTKEGSLILEKTMPLWKKAQNRILQEFGKDRYHRVIGELEALRVIANLPKLRYKNKDQDNVVRLN